MNILDQFVTFGELMGEVIQHRSEINIDSMCNYGLDILDDYIGGIHDNDLVVVGADTGVGKSDFAYKTAINNAMRGKKVLLFSLEGDIYEIMYRYLQNQMNLDGKGKVRTIDYRFNLTDTIEREMMVGAKTPKQLLDNILIFKKTKIPEVSEIVEYIKKFRESVDLVVLDHLHYIDFGTSSNEAQSIGAIMRELKMTTDILRIPVVLVAHLRKRSKIDDDPTIYDLHGSSNIGKEATTVILLSREEKSNIESICAYHEVANDSRYAGTKLLVVKSRAGLPPAKLCLVYDVVAKQYVQERSCFANDSKATVEDLISYGS